MTAVSSDVTAKRAWVRQIMGMPISIHLRGPHVRQAWVEQIVEAVYADLTWVEHTFSLHRPDSPLSQLRCGVLALAEATAFHPEIGEVLLLCQEATRRTEGSFAWLLPDADGRLRIEPTGLVKGWAIERAARRLEQVTGHAYLVNAGGDIAVGGIDSSQDGDRPWRLGVENPADRSQIAQVVELRQGALATSGTAARGAHLVDPHTGERTTRTGSVSVVGPSVLWADVWATALFVGPMELAARALGGDRARLGRIGPADAWEVIRQPAVTVTCSC